MDTTALPSADIAAEAQQALAALTGRPDAVFHPGQLEAISALVEHRRGMGRKERRAIAEAVRFAEASVASGTVW
ncbi:hypothetical protein IAE22_32885, partial [Bacillus sp. S34]|nr:hypothetical protein [Bacillus sp. S34]